MPGLVCSALGFSYSSLQGWNIDDSHYWTNGEIKVERG